MTIISSSPLAKIAADIEAMLRKRMSGPEAQSWLLTGNEQLGGQSPIQAIKAGRIDEAHRAAIGFAECVEMAK